jgi:hypothetical protein
MNFEAFFELFFYPNYGPKRGALDTPDQNTVKDQEMA